MAITIRNITFDCADALKLATFWAQLAGWHVYTDGDPEVFVAPSYPPQNHPNLLFIPVPEGKTAKNRVHLDVVPTDRTRDEAVEHAVGLGATVVGDFRNEKGGGWVTLTDPEGNEFCIERSEAERGTPQSRTFQISS